MKYIILSLSLLGCMPTEETFAEKFANRSCVRMKDCERGAFESNYNDLQDCRQDLLEDAEDIADFYDDVNCDFEPEEAKKCLDSMRFSTCEEFYEGDVAQDCEHVYDC